MQGSRRPLVFNSWVQKVNDLDRKIAELKGIPYQEFTELNYIQEVVKTATTWSSDAKALELVDELAVHDDVCGFELFLVATVPKRIWKAEFAVHGEPRQIGCVEESRPEAICRAYIAAMTWLKEKDAAVTPSPLTATEYRIVHNIPPLGFRKWMKEKGKG